MTMEDEFKVDLGFFEGPLDLLLFLVKKEELSIWEISLTKITDEYLRYLQEKKFINPSREADFLLMASILIHIKSSRLLPKIKLEEGEEDEEYALKERIETYGLIKKFANALKMLEESINIMRRGKIEEIEEEIMWEVPSLYEIAKAFIEIAKRKEKDESIPYRDRKISIEEKISEILNLLRNKKIMRLLEYVENSKSIEEIIVTFLAVLELIKRGFIMAKQKKEFGEIEIRLYRKGTNERRAYA